MKPLMIDIYHGDDTSGNFFHDIAADGIEFVAIKSWQGSHQDPSFRESVTRAQIVGLKVIAYEFLVNDVDGPPGEQQAKYLMESCAGLGPLVLCLDYESPTGVTFESVLHDAAEQIATSTGKHPLLYGSDLLQEAYSSLTSDEMSSGLWVAGYGEFPRWGMGHTVWWQYTDSGTVGERGPLDASYWMPNPHFADAHAWFDARSVTL